MARKQGVARVASPPREAPLKESPPPVVDKSDPALTLAPPSLPPPPHSFLSDSDIARIVAFLKTLDETPPPAEAVEPSAPVAAHIGMRVVYRLNVRDVDQIIARRVKLSARGNAPVSGDEHAGLIVALASPQVATITVFLDGEDTLWAQHRPQGTSNGHWRPA